MITEEKLIKQGNCNNCMYLGTTSCPDIMLMEKLDLDSYSCMRWKGKNEEDQDI